MARLFPDKPLPPYTYVPNRGPHPVSDPLGHSFGREPEPAIVTPENWRTCEAYLFGLDCFNAGFYWESHTYFESLWLGVGRKGAVADFLKGLIKLAAAGVKTLEGRADGVRSHAARAIELFRAAEQASGSHEMLGLSLPALGHLARTILDDDWPKPCLTPNRAIRSVLET